MSIPRRWAVIVVGIALLVAACDHGPGHSVEQLPRQAESEHFVFHFATGDHVDVTWQEGYYDWLVEELEVQVPKKMNYFKYRDRSHLEHLTGKNGNGYADSRAYSFHTIWPIDNHESVHVVVFNTIGRASALFDEGIAVAHQVDPTGPDERPQWSGTDIHEIARDHYRAGTIPALSSLLKSTAFRTHDPNTTYPLAGSFVRYPLSGASSSASKSRLLATVASGSRRAMTLGWWLVGPLASFFMGFLAMVAEFLAGDQALQNVRTDALDLAGRATGENPRDVNYIIPAFVLGELPIIIPGLFIAAVLAAAMSSISSELNSLSTATVIDFYRRRVRPNASDAHYLMVSKLATGFWGVFACGVALYAVALGSLIEVVNRFGSFFYGSILGVFMLAFIPFARGRGAFFGLFAGMGTVAAVSFVAPEISFLWHNVIGAVTVVVIGSLLSLTAPDDGDRAAGSAAERTAA